MVGVTAADEDPAIAGAVGAAQRHAAPRLKPVVRATARRVGEIAQVVGDKGFDGQPQRDAVRAVGAEPVIPAKKNRVAPEPLDVPAYRERNRVERLFAKAKEFRRVATRYDKRKRMYLGWLHLVFGFIRLRTKTKQEREKKTNVNTA